MHWGMCAFSSLATVIHLPLFIDIGTVGYPFEREDCLKCKLLIFPKQKTIYMVCTLIFKYSSVITDPCMQCSIFSGMSCPSCLVQVGLELGFNFCSVCSFINDTYHIYLDPRQDFPPPTPTAWWRWGLILNLSTSPGQGSGSALALASDPGLKPDLSHHLLWAGI